MAYQIPTSEPAEGQAGESWFWDISYPDFPADESWELSYYLRGPVDADFVFGTEVTADGAGFEVRVPATTTDDITTSGAYRLIGRVSKSGEVHTVYDAHFLVRADPSTAVGAKSYNRTRLEELQAATTPNPGIRVVEINGRRTEYGVEDYERQLARYTYLVAIEENPYGSVVHETVFSRA